MGSNLSGPEAAAAGVPQTTAELQEESRKLRRVQLMMDMVMAAIAQDGSMNIDEAAQLIAYSRNAVLALFPGKEEAYNMLYRPRLQRLMRERFRIQ